MLDGLSTPERLLLLKFLCAFAWTDLDVSDKERTFVRRVVELADLDTEGRAEVEGWLAIAPAPASVNPKQVPREHRKVFVDAIRALIYADGKVDEDERASLERLKEALARES